MPDYLSKLGIDIFIKIVSYIHFKDLINICLTNTILCNYCTNIKYNNHWKFLIDKTYNNVYNYQHKIQSKLSKNLNGNIYNYLVYTRLINLCDLISQAVIYHNQNDMISFNHFTIEQQFLSLFLIGKSNIIEKYLPDKPYLFYNSYPHYNPYIPFIDMLNGNKISRDNLNNMLIIMIKNENIKGSILILSKGADIHVDDNRLLKWASQYGHLEVVKFLISQGVDIHVSGDFALRFASLNGHFKTVKYLVKHGANIHKYHDEALKWASTNGHIKIVSYLKSFI